MAEAADWGGDTTSMRLFYFHTKEGELRPPARNGHMETHGSIFRQELTTWVFQERKTQEEGKADSTGESAERLLLLK